MLEFKNKMASATFGIMLTEAWDRKICIKCQNPMWKMRLTQFDIKEWKISGLCPTCWGEIMGAIETIDANEDNNT